MGRVMLCVGDYAKTPYYIEQIQQKVFCIEELCYSFLENAFLFDQSIVNKSLVEWIDRECGLPELARQLYGYVNAKCSVSVFITVIMEYAAWCPKEDISNTRMLLQNNANMGDLEKKKSHADYMMQQKRYAMAIREYNNILDSLTEDTEKFRGAVCHNKGVAYAGLFLFETAAEWFQKAYEADGEQESALSYLAAKRFAMSEKEYIDFIADKTGAYGPSLELEQRLEQSVQGWENSEQGNRWMQLMEKKETGKMAEYYAEVRRMTEQMKDEYKRMA